MSFFSNATHWFVSSGLADQTKQIAVKELTAAAQALMSKVEEHSPDMKGQVEQSLATALTTAIAGTLTRTSTNK